MKLAGGQHLDLCAGPVDEHGFRLEHRLDQLTEPIAHERTASLNPDLVVVVGGRIFGTGGKAVGAGPAGHRAAQGAGVGADASAGSSSQAEAPIRLALHMPGYAR